LKWNGEIRIFHQHDLPMGVLLTSEQVSGLTHDIVWREELELNGEKVLLPESSGQRNI
jgi:hypothetical protein